jgi:hypothetical protein
MVRENGNGEDPSAKGDAGKRKKNCSSGVGDGGRRRSFAACCATSKIAKLWWCSPKIGLGEFGPGPQEQSTELPGLAIWNFTTTHSLPWVCHHLLCSLHIWFNSVPDRPLTEQWRLPEEENDFIIELCCCSCLRPAHHMTNTLRPKLKPELQRK